MCDSLASHVWNNVRGKTEELLKSSVDLKTSDMNVEAWIKSVTDLVSRYAFENLFCETIQIKYVPDSPDAQRFYEKNADNLVKLASMGEATKKKEQVETIIAEIRPLVSELWKNLKHILNEYEKGYDITANDLRWT